MVKGLEKFKEYFTEFTDNYVIIGGTACDIIIEDAGFNPRATKDIDMIIIVEAKSEEFIKNFWLFIKDGKYEKKEISADNRQYYRFVKPEITDFPYQIELFSRNPDLKGLGEETHLTPIPVDEGLSSLSAILLEDEYYHYLIKHSCIVNGIHIANNEALIVLKAKAWIDINERLSQGFFVERRQLSKHKNDIFRLTLMLDSGSYFNLHGKIKQDMQKFIKAVAHELPAKDIFKTMGIEGVNPASIFKQLKESYKIDKES
ncbi:MAG: hypothetical protein JXR34_00230 [Bacteroidales bacterium]|nr:hypothetical protein [Bacteroidales bacterium]